jgi:hypothetical protein
MVVIERALIADVTRHRTMSMSFDGACAVDAGALRGPASYTGGSHGMTFCRRALHT